MKENLDKYKTKVVYESGAWYVTLVEHKKDWFIVPLGPFKTRAFARWANSELKKSLRTINYIVEYT
jgi:hypothetical protein